MGIRWPSQRPLERGMRCRQRADRHYPLQVLGQAGLRPSSTNPGRSAPDAAAPPPIRSRHRRHRAPSTSTTSPQRRAPAGRAACTACRSALRISATRPGRSRLSASILMMTNHPAQLALSGIAHHALSRQFDPVCALMTISAVSTRPARRWPGRRNRDNPGVDPDARGCLRCEIHHGRGQGMAGFWSWASASPTVLPFSRRSPWRQWHLVANNSASAEAGLLRGGHRADQGSGTKGLELCISTSCSPEQNENQRSISGFGGLDQPRQPDFRQSGAQPQDQATSDGDQQQTGNQLDGARRNSGPRLSARTTPARPPAERAPAGQSSVPG